MTLRTKNRILLHHVPIVVGSGVVLTLFFLSLASDDLKFRASLSTAYVSLLLLAGTLLPGALNVLAKRRNPISSDLRRDLGIWCGIFALIHVAVGLQVHMGSMLLYFVRKSDAHDLYIPRTDIFGFANYLGIGAAVITLLLLVISNDASLRRLRSARWKLFQRSSYVLFILTVLHAIAYQYIESRKVVYILFFAIAVIVPVAVQLNGYRVFRRGTRSSGFIA